MLTREQEQIELDAAYKVEEEIERGRWKGIDRDCLYIISCDPGVSIEIKLDSYIQGLSLVGLPDFSEDGKYLIQLTMEKGAILSNRSFIQESASLLEPSAHDEIICDGLFENDYIYDVVTTILGNLLKSLKMSQTNIKTS